VRNTDAVANLAVQLFGDSHPGYQLQLVAVRAILNNAINRKRIQGELRQFLAFGMIQVNIVTSRRMKSVML
jgi:hypothetical protein